MYFLAALAVAAFAPTCAHAGGAHALGLDFLLPHRFAHDVRVALRGLSAPAPPHSKRALTGAGRCLAVRAPRSNNGTSVAGGGGGHVPPLSGSPPGVPPSNSSSSGGANSPWKVAQHWAGSSFFDGWDFFNTPDPTAGFVNYVDQGTAQAHGLIDINSAGNALMRVETTNNLTGPRMSVRISSQYSYTGALIILDALHMPTGCGTWPAFWSSGPNWPEHGEIDIVEGVNQNSDNQATIHTRGGCSVPATAAAAGASGTLVGGSNCDVTVTNNAGCGMVANTPGSYGAPFNAAGGGVYATLWDDTAISVWFFPRSRGIPSDIPALAPNPAAWGTPFARWPATNCPTLDFFNNHVAIFDTTLCGVWAGNVWSSGGCAASTGFSTCEAFVAARGDAFAQAYWEVASVTIFQHK